MIDYNPTISIIILGTNGINVKKKKRDILPDNIDWLQEIHLKYKDINTKGGLKTGDGKHCEGWDRAGLYYWLTRVHCYVFEEAMLASEISLLGVLLSLKIPQSTNQDFFLYWRTSC